MEPSIEGSGTGCPGTTARLLLQVLDASSPRCGRLTGESVTGTGAGPRPPSPVISMVGTKPGRASWERVILEEALRFCLNLNRGCAGDSATSATDVAHKEGAADSGGTVVSAPIGLRKWSKDIEGH